MADIAIIGAGIGGMSAAIHLRAAGHTVTIYEKNDRTGGKMYQLEKDGFRWDTGPSVITMRHVFADLYAAAGRRMEDYLKLLPVEPLTRYFFPDGTILDATRDLSAMARQIEQIEPRDVEGYLSYLAYAARIHRITGPVFIYDKPPTPASFARVPVQDWLKADPFRTMRGAIEAHVRSPQLRQLLSRFATYVGGSPYEAPATLNVIAHVEMTGGVWYPQGGIYRIAEAMQTLAEEIGVRILTGCPVEEIVVENGRVQGIKAGGETIPADAVISNLDVTSALNHLLPSGTIAEPKLRSLSDYEASCSGFILLLGVEGQHEQLAHHNSLFSSDYRAEFEAIFRTLEAPQDPTLYIAITSHTDAEHAPPGHENWFLMVNVPPLSDRFDWEQQRLPYRDHVLKLLAERWGIDIRDKIRSETILTPVELERMSGAWRGALYGPSANNRFSVFRRPHNRSKDIRGLYFAGGTTHPGGGVPMVTLSGKVAADFIMDDLRNKHL